MREGNRFRFAYASAFTAYLAEGGESTRCRAYEIGREAVAGGLSVLDLADAHHEALLAALRKGADPEAATRAAGDFFLDSLSAYEMVQRGLAETLQATRLQRRHAEILRQLSNFLADASLALNARDSMHEILHLVCEQARELIGGACCVAALRLTRGSPALRAASSSEADAAWGARLALTDLSSLESLVGSARPVVRLSGEELMCQPARRALARGAGDDRPVQSWLAAPLTILDGRDIGFIHLFDYREGAFSSGDEAVLVQLAQMASAAVERARLYAPAAPPQD